ncbi:MAG: aspartate--tRNA(Asn) ligase [archaeon]|nr:aspartate--tRNA(Asn) ligase [archaeon]
MVATYRDSNTITADDGTVVVRGWIQDIRNLGGISFVTLRDRFGTIQLTLIKKIIPEIFAKVTRLTRESVIVVTGDVKVSNQTELGLEIIPSDVKVYSEAITPLPMGVIDKVNVDMSTRLNNRFIDIRKAEIKAIFELKSIMSQLIVEVMNSNGFTQVYTPKIGSSGAEGGSTLFSVNYFGKKAFLAQSPQLYKQILMSTGMDKVFELGPVFRAEQSNTNRHVTEFISFDGEMSWIEREEDVMHMVETVLDYVLKGISERGKKQLEILKKEVKIQPIPYPVITYAECLKIVNDAGLKLKNCDDLGTEGEKIIGDVMSKKGVDFYFITEYPEESKPFYIMEKDGTSYSFSFDLDYKGQEISSGGQREHRYDRLVERIQKKGLNPDDFTFYTDAFKYGMPPHGGWGIGIERLLTKMLDLPNIREAIIFPRDPSRISP